MPITREDALEQLAKLGQQYAQKELGQANEATTRLLLVDEVLTILGWQKSEFNPETKIRNYQGYTDYQLGERQAPRLIVEAKRVGSSFASPRQILRKSEYELTYLQNAFGQNLTEVVEQARQYCEHTRVPYAILTNGAEWIIAQLISPPGRTFSTLRAYYAGNLLQQGSSFDILWNLASYDSVTQGGLEENFDLLNRREFEFSQSPRDAVGDLTSLGVIPATVPHLRDFYHYFFDEIVDPQRYTMLQHCYVSTSRLAQYESEIKRTLEDSAPKFVEGAEELEPGQTEKIVIDRGGDKRGRVVLIVGSVGVGKTTFVTKVMRDSAKQGRNILLNLIDETSVTEEFLWRLIANSIRQSHSALVEYETLKKAFHRELEQLKRGPRSRTWASDPDAWMIAEADELERCQADTNTLVVATFKMLRSEHVPVAVFIDNADRLDESHQRTVYSFAHKLSAQSGCTTIVPIRETTYFRAHEQGFLDVRTSDAVFHLQAPDIAQVLSRRIKYIERQLDDKDVSPDPRIKEWRRQSDWREFRDAMVEYSSELKGALLSDKTGTSIVTVLAAIAWHSVRRLFRVLRHVHGMLRAHSLQWTFNNVVGTLIVPEDSVGSQFISNDLFVSPAPRVLCHLLRLRIILFLRATPTLGGRGGMGFDRIVRTMRTYGYRTPWIQNSVEYLVHSRLIECLEIPAGADAAQRYTVSDRHSYRVSALGILMITEILRQRSYLAAAGWTINYLRDESYNEFLSEASAVRALVVENNGSAADMLATSKLAEIFVVYLHDTLEEESIQSAAVLSYPDIATIESELENVLRMWREEFPILDEPLAPEPSAEGKTSTPQMILPGVPLEREVKTIIRPANVSNATLEGRSLVAAQILWVLVDAAANGIPLLSGAEITERMNKQIRGDNQRVLGTNVSRTLRTQLLRSQKWLRVVQDHPAAKPRYGVQAGWEDVWWRTFMEPPPLI